MKYHTLVAYPSYRFTTTVQSDAILKLEGRNYIRPAYSALILPGWKQAEKTYKSATVTYLVQKEDQSQVSGYPLFPLTSTNSGNAIILRVTEYCRFCHMFVLRFMSQNKEAIKKSALCLQTSKINGELILNTSSFQKQATPSWRNPITENQIQKMFSYHLPLPVTKLLCKLSPSTEDLVHLANSYLGLMVWSEEGE